MIEEVTDLRIVGRGFDFRWQRTYRSRSGPNTAQGNGWDHPYDVHLTAGDREDLELHDGNGRGDIYTRQPNGSWTRAEFFREITRAEDGSFKMVFEDKGEWRFLPLDGTPRGGRMSESVDRNGNRMSFRYDAQGRLSVVTDTLGRDIGIAYNPDGFIESVTDFAGRAIRYTYYRAGDAGGGFGDLKSVTSPAVVGTPNGNDFPDGKTITYTYSTGFADERLNHNLLTITDGRRNDPSDPTHGDGPYLVNVYSPATDPGDPNFDRVIRQVWGGGILDFTHVPMLPGAFNGFAISRVIVNDRVGNVSESFFDAGNRMVRTRQFTGRALPDQPTTLLENRPRDPLRESDPEYFETLYEWTGDSLQRRVVHPNGNTSEYVYEADLNPDAPARTRGNLRIVRSFPGSGSPLDSQPMIENRYDYDTDFGSCCGFNFLARETDGLGNVTRHEYDERGNRIRTIGPIPTVVEEWTYNEFGQFSAHILPPNPEGHRRRDEQEYYGSGPQMGYLHREIVDASGLRLATTFEYDPLGNVVKVTDPLGREAQRIVNSHNQVVRVLLPEVTTGSGTIRYQQDYAYDANNNLIRVDVRNFDESGVAQANRDLTTRIDYEALNQPVRVAQEIDETRSAVTEFAYDANRNRVLVRQPEAVNGRQPDNVIRMVFDERDMLFRTIAAPGHAAQSTSQRDYDGNGNPVRTLEGLESGARLSASRFDGYNRLVALTDAMGNTMTRQYDAAHNLVRLSLQGELVDGPGSGNNVRLMEVTRMFDALNRVIREDRAHFDPASRNLVGDGISSGRQEYAPNSQLARLINDNGNDVRFTYDTANRLLATTDAKGNRIARIYDAADNILETVATEKSDLGGADSEFRTRTLFDNLDRPTRVIDQAGNINEFAYDSRNNLVLMMDAARASANEPGNRTRYAYDGLDRLIRTSRELTSNGSGSGSPAGRIETSREWDDNSRPVTVLDGNGNATRLVYDPLDRLIETINAAGASRVMTHNAHSDTVIITDPNATVVRQEFDALGRVVRRDITPAPGVATDTTFEIWGYDGLSRIVQAENDGSKVARAYDSLGNLTLDAIDGGTAERAHDGVGNPILTRYPGGRTVTAAFDQLERLQSLADASGAAPVAIANFDYAGPDLLVRQSNGNNTRMETAYDSIKRPVRLTHSLIGGGVFEDRDYGWDANSNRILNRDRLPDGFAQDYAYDSVQRLRSVAFTGVLNQSRDYELDGAGNRLAVTGDGDAGRYAFGAEPSNDAALNQYTSTPFDQRAYDDNGNLVGLAAAGRTRRLQFDYRDRLVRHEAEGVVSRYVYDALGRRIASVFGEAPADTTRFLYFGWQVLEERDGAGATLATYVFGEGLNEVVGMRRGGRSYWLHADDQMSVRRITDASGNLVESYAYDEFGNPAILDSAGQVVPASAVGNPYLFTGHRFDLETGLYHARHRYYDPAAGRFISRDPSGAWGDPMNSGNAFAYVGNNPATFVDPLGLTSVRPRASEFVGPGLGAPASTMLRNGANLSDEALQAAIRANRVGTDVARTLNEWYRGFIRGTVHAGGEGGQLVRMLMRPKEAAAMVSMMFEGGEISPLRHARDWDRFMSEHGALARQRAWYQAAQAEIAAAERQAAQLAQRGSRLRTAGRVLGVVSVGVNTGTAIYENYKNCLDVGTSINDAAATGVASTLVLAAPPVAIVDAVTGGSVTGLVGNALKTPGTLIRLTGRVNGRDAAAIKRTFTRTAVGRFLWSAGEFLAGD